jgi:hypothetical protein
VSNTLFPVAVSVEVGFLIDVILSDKVVNWYWAKFCITTVLLA